MHLFLEKGMQGCILFISKRYSKNKNKRLTFYDPKKPVEHATYLSKNNLYGYAISKSLTTGEF